MQEIEFTKEDEYCIRNFGYNEVKDYEDLKQLEDKDHLIVEELEYRLQQKENIIKEVREYIEKNKQLSMFADLRKDGVHNYDLECDADDLLNILKGEIDKGE